MQAVLEWLVAGLTGLVLISAAVAMVMYLSPGPDLTTVPCEWADLHPDFPPELRKACHEAGLVNPTKTAIGENQ
jgi:hypothetical protein